MNEAKKIFYHSKIITLNHNVLIAFTVYMVRGNNSSKLAEIERGMST